MTAPRFLLVHSPFVGSESWRPTAEALQARGAEAVVAHYRISDDSDHASVAATVGAEVEDDGWVLTLHSGAGPLAPAVAQEVGCAAVLFVDALLPSPGRSWRDTAPSQLADALERRSDGRRLPTWNAWFGEEAMAKLMPDALQRLAFEDDLPNVPIAWLDRRAPAMALPSSLPGAYLRLSAAYEADAASAEAAGWPVWRLDLDHLAIVTRPDTVAATLLELAP